MILIPLVALILGLLLGALVVKDAVPVQAAPYLGVAILASLDSVSGGIRSQLDGKFQADIFITGFLANIGAAMFLTWLGDNIGIGLVQAAAVVFGIRIFTNLSLIRRIMLTRIADNKRRKLSEQGKLETKDTQV